MIRTIAALVEKYEHDTSSDIPSVPLLKEALITCRQMEAFLRILLVSYISDARLFSSCGISKQESMYVNE